MALWSNRIHEDVAWLNPSWYIIVWFHGYDEVLTLAEYILEYYSIRHDLVIVSKLIIQLIHCNNHLVSTFICSWLSSYILVGIFFKEKSHISLMWCVIDLNQTHSQLTSWGHLFLYGLKMWLSPFVLVIVMCFRSNYLRIT